MRDPVKAWLLERGYLPAVEFWLHNAGITDIVAGLYSDRIGRRIPNLENVIAVELKMNDVAGVIQQAKQNQYLSDWSYAAMPCERIEKMRAGTFGKFHMNGIGLLAVGCGVTEVVSPIRGDGLPAHRSEVKQLWRRVRSQASDN